MAPSKKGGGRGRGAHFQSPIQRRPGACYRSIVNVTCLIFVGIVYYANFKWYSKEGSSFQDSASAIQSLAAQTSIQLRSKLAEVTSSSSSSSLSSYTLPYRSSEEMEDDVECLHQGVSHLHFYHMRKAGGSSVRTLLVNMTKMEGWQNQVFISQSEGLTFNTTCFTERPQVFLTSMRDPISRIISSYKYEGRLERFDRRMFPKFEIPEELKDLAAGREEPRPILFRQWVDNVMARYASDPPEFKADHIWVDVDNYYIKTLVNRYRDVSQPINEKDLEMAKKVLSGFDLVVITEWMSNRDQTDYWNAVLGTKIYMDFPFRQTSSNWRYANLLDDDTIAYLKELNKYDIELYEFAKELTKSRMDAVLGKDRSSGNVLGTKRDRGGERQCVSSDVVVPQYTYEGHKNIITRGIAGDPFCMYPRDIHKPPKIY